MEVHLVRYLLNIGDFMSQSPDHHTNRCYTTVNRHKMTCSCPRLPHNWMSMKIQEKQQPWTLLLILNLLTFAHVQTVLLQMLPNTPKVKMTCSPAGTLSTLSLKWNDISESRQRLKIAISSDVATFLLHYCEHQHAASVCSVLTHNWFHIILLPNKKFTLITNE